MQAQLKQALDAALAEARKAARPGQLDVQTGNFSIYPRYAHATRGGISGWQGTAELVVEGRDMPAIAQLTGRIAHADGRARRLRPVARGARGREAEVAPQAIARYRAKATDYARSSATPATRSARSS